MLIKLRIPLFFAITSITVALYNILPFLLIYTDSYILSSSQYIISIILLFYIFEKININNIESDISIGVIIILLSMIINVYI